MPINPNALATPEVIPPATPQEASAIEGTQQQHANEDAASEQAARPKRRNRAQMIADAVVPADAEMVEVKDVHTGAKVQRPWREAVELVKTGAVEFADKTMKYAVQKMEQQAAAPAFQGAADPQPAATDNIDQPQPTPNPNVPPDAAVGDEVRSGSETYRVGHGGVLTTGPVAVDGAAVKAKRRWQRELGAGPNGAWESVALTHTDPQRPIFEKAKSGPLEVQEDIVSQAVRTGKPAHETVKLPHTQEVLPDGIVKVGTGLLEKIGLPDYSSMQIGPISISRSIQDDGRRSTVTFADGRTGEVITSAIEAFEVMDNTVEFIAARFRGQVVAFLQSTGALKQPAS